MYLAESLELEERTYPMCGVLPFGTRMPAPLQIAYVEIETRGGLLGSGRRARGHAFHHSEVIGATPASPLFKMRTSRGEESDEGYGADNVLASYAHLHFASDPGIAPTLVAACVKARSLD
jgi:cobyrinic acid a,c-diamide synthase